RVMQKPTTDATTAAKTAPTFTTESKTYTITSDTVMKETVVVGNNVRIKLADDSITASEINICKDGMGKGGFKDKGVMGTVTAITSDSITVDERVMQKPTTDATTAAKTAPTFTTESKTYTITSDTVMKETVAVGDNVRIKLADDSTTAKEIVKALAPKSSSTTSVNS
ncbi:MAG: hypothetical protein Q8865_10510, partial [Bacillota bacterium]|nr:hypothetical protein [Bacillota bacterium]